VAVLLQQRAKGKCFASFASLEGYAYLTKVVVLEDIKPCEIEKNIYISFVNIQTARKIFG
jgi:hypothetical protein